MPKLSNYVGVQQRALDFTNMCEFSNQEFRALMNQSPEMRLKLETAIKNSRGSKSDDSAKGDGAQTPAAPAPGTIKLKTDFSNYAS